MKPEIILAFIDDLKEQLALTEKRIERLCATQMHFLWSAYYPDAEAEVGIAVHIEVQEAIRDYITQEIARYEQDLAKLAAMVTADKPKEQAQQLKLV